MLVTIDDKLVKTSDVPLFADGVNVHANLIPRAEFRRVMEGSLRQSFIHALVAKGRLLYTHDATIGALCAHLHEIGTRDTEVQLLRAATHALPPIYKAHKFWETRGDLDYTALWILYSASPLAQIEVVSHRLIADREVIPFSVNVKGGRCEECQGEGVGEVSAAAAHAGAVRPRRCFPQIWPETPPGSDRPNLWKTPPGSDRPNLWKTPPGSYLA